MRPGIRRREIYQTMLRRLHHDQSGRFNVLHVLAIAILVGGGYALAMYYPPYYQFLSIRTAAEQVARSSTSTQWNDVQNKQWFDGEMDRIGAEYPTSRDLFFQRYDKGHVVLSFEYEYAIKHFFMKNPHVLRFEYRCVSRNGDCFED